MEPQDRTEISVCIGTFDTLGVPIAVSGHMSDWATVAFQAISLNMLLSQSLNLKPADVTYIHTKDGASVRIERNHKGFTGYLDAHS
jgi:hypothetical protein